MKIAILGTRGIPNNYGGFEQFAEYLSAGLVKKGHDVTVYNPHYHTYTIPEYNGVRIIKKYNPEKFLGSAANYLYDYLCLKDALNQGFDIILECGYTSAPVSYYMCRINKSVIITNMDGMEWKRKKWSYFPRLLIKRAEQLAVKRSHHLVVDNIIIQKYYKKKYKKDISCIPYGADIFNDPDEKKIKKYGLEPGNYFLTVARIVPENNIEMILQGYIDSGSEKKLLIIGNPGDKYGSFLAKKYSRHKNIIFYGDLYYQEDLDNLRYFSSLYFHGHSVGGTNPSLLESMATGCLVCAHDNIYNHSVIEDNALYFKSRHDVSDLIKNADQYISDKDIFVKNNHAKIQEIYSWDKVVGEYEEFFAGITGKQRQ